MTGKQQETEVKVLVHDLGAVRTRLEKLQAVLIHPRIFERNVRYDDASGTLAERGIVLRLREDQKIRLTYKSPGTIERGIMSREELEVQVSDFRTMEQIISRLGYSRAMLYEKYRTTYQIGQAEIMLDELPYGNFVEVEGDMEIIEAVLRQISLDQVERRAASYTRLFDFVKHHLDLSFRDLTFANFEGIEVPETAFIPPGSIVVG